MNLTEIRVKLLPQQQDKLRGFASITVDDAIVIRDIKIIEGGNGLFVAMPSRKLCDRCQACAGKNHVRARYCNECGERLRHRKSELDERGRPRLYADIAHPINQASRDYVQTQVIKGYYEELERSKEAGYKSVVFDDLDYDYLAEFTAR